MRPRPPPRGQARVGPLTLEEREERQASRQADPLVALELLTRERREALDCRSFSVPISMSEMSHVSKDHRHARFIGSGNHLFIAH